MRFRLTLRDRVHGTWTEDYDRADVADPRAWAEEAVGAFNGSRAPYERRELVEVREFGRDVPLFREAAPERRPVEPIPAPMAPQAGERKPPAYVPGMGCSAKGEQHSFSVDKGSYRVCDRCGATRTKSKSERAAIAAGDAGAPKA